MAQQMRKQVKVALNKGLITEATPLTFPEDATTSELNVDFERDGHRSKRRGFNLESLGTFVDVGATPESVYNSFTWNYVGGKKTVSYLVVQVDSTLHFFDLSKDTVSEGYKAQSVPLSQYTSGPATLLSFARIKGDLVVASPNMDTVRIKEEGNVFVVDKIQFKIRDFEYLTPSRASLTERGLPDPPIFRKYDSFNTGWHSKNYFNDFISYFGASPELTKPWFSSKNSSGSYSSKEWDKTGGGNTLITNGHYILDLYTMDRDSASGLIGTNEWVQQNRPELLAETSRFSTVANYAGRVFYAGMGSHRSMSRVYFSQVVQDGTELGLLHSVNDPTAEYLSDLLDTDGGYVDLPDAEGISRLHVYGTHLLVFAANGVWAISGVDDVFRATDYTVNRITSLGLRNNGTFVAAQGRPYWWSDVGIHTIGMSEFKNLEEQSITETTIKGFFLDIPDEVRNAALGVYDERAKRVYWHYGPSSSPTTHSNLLVLDEMAGAFAPWAIAVEAEDPMIVSSFYNTQPKNTSLLEEVIDLQGNIVYDAAGEPVAAQREGQQYRPTGTFFVVLQGTSLGFAQFYDDSMYDWGDRGYDAYLETGYRYLGDISGFSNAPYLTVLCRRTETVWGEEGPLNQSSLKASAYWDYKSVPAARPQEMYKIRRFLLPQINGDMFVSEHDHVMTKVVPRGRGHSLKIRFEGAHGKDFRLIGFETLDAKNNTV